METQNYIEYELVDSVSDRNIMTDSREEAIHAFEKGWTVYEHHNTINQHSKFTQSNLTVTMMWNDNPEFQGS
ncbi:MAG TPA: hypothetical protein DEB39_07365 [Planctomycetaceae bacterium]|nr:hypothetical protein [Planctomycetaceae bacterium]